MSINATGHPVKPGHLFSVHIGQSPPVFVGVYVISFCSIRNVTLQMVESERTTVLDTRPVALGKTLVRSIRKVTHPIINVMDKNVSHRLIRMPSGRFTANNKGVYCSAKVKDEYRLACRVPLSKDGFFFVACEMTDIANHVEPAH